jgi:O-acetyl-ADP-ribose deacetylase (regulator of RNase III)
MKARREKKQVSMNVNGFAASLRTWVKEGYDVFGDTKGCGCGATIRSVVLDAEYLDDPVKAATSAWLKANKNAASNGAIMRTAPLGIMDFSDTARVISNTKKYCKATHVDPRALASCIASTVSIASMLKQGASFDPMDTVATHKVADKALSYALKELDDEEHKSGLAQHFMVSSMADLKLDEPDSIGYTYKALGCVGFLLRNVTDFRRGMELITLEAGDADTNAAIAGAVLGCKLGFSAIPPELVDGLVHKDWLEERVGQLLRLMGLNSTTELPNAAERVRRRKYYLCGDRFATVGNMGGSDQALFQIWRGDITSLEIDAIVNVADAEHFPEPVGALDQRVHFAAGPQFAQECRFIGKMSVAGAEITPGCLLPAACTLQNDLLHPKLCSLSIAVVIHTVTPPQGDKSKLKECYFSALNAAASAGFGSIAFPLLGSSKLSPAAAAAIAIDSLQQRPQKSQEKSPSIKKIVLVAFNDAQEKALQSSLATGISSSSS